MLPDCTLYLNSKKPSRTKRKQPRARCRKVLVLQPCSGDQKGSTAADSVVGSRERGGTRSGRMHRIGQCALDRIGHWRLEVRPAPGYCGLWARVAVACSTGAAVLVRPVPLAALCSLHSRAAGWSAVFPFENCGETPDARVFVWQLRCMHGFLLPQCCWHTRPCELLAVTTSSIDEKGGRRRPCVSHSTNGGQRPTTSTFLTHSYLPPESCRRSGDGGPAGPWSDLHMLMVVVVVIHTTSTTRSELLSNVKSHGVHYCSLQAEAEAG
jgi:hypothetical protein